LLPVDDSDLKLKSLFQGYYRNWTGRDVDLIGERELGFIPFFGTMIRHRAVRNLSDLGFFVRKNTPRHIYYSTAYYKTPDEKVMKEKGWKGAELIFDLDADHLSGADKMSYSEILSEVKKHTQRLIFKFLMDDLGFEEKDLKLFFSGGRGYHVHVVEDSVYQMTSDSRREIANYIRGEGFTTFDVRRSMQETSHKLSGWKKTIDDSICGFYSDLLGNSEKQEILHGLLGNIRTMQNYLTDLNRSTQVGGNLKRIEVLTMPGFSKYRIMDKNDEKVLNYIVVKVKNEGQCEIDEPVTTDIHRLIRMPHSLHGKTGLAVVPIKLEEFLNFDPLKDAVAEAFRNNEVRINLMRNYQIDFDGESHNLLAGEQSVPGPVGVFLAASKLAKLL
jgi:DNA primase small subunit